MAPHKVGDVLRVVSSRKVAEAAFVHADAQWEEDMAEYLGQTGVAVQVDETSTELRHNDDTEYWWANDALTKDEHPTLLTARGREGAGQTKAAARVPQGPDGAGAASRPAPTPAAGLGQAAAAATSIFGEAYGNAAAAATGLFSTVTTSVTNAAAAVPGAQLPAMLSPLSVSARAAPAAPGHAQSPTLEDAQRGSEPTPSPAPRATAAALIDATPSPALARALPADSALPRRGHEQSAPPPAHPAAAAQGGTAGGGMAVAALPPVPVAEPVATVYPHTQNPGQLSAPVGAWGHQAPTPSSGAGNPVHTPATPQQRRFFFPPQQQQQPPLPPSEPQGQRGYVGLNVTKQAPFIVLGASDIMDPKGILQGHAGYGNAPVEPGDQLVRVDGHGVEFGGLKSLQHLLGGELGSVVELVFSRNNHQFTIRALRHGAPSSSGGLVVNQPVVLNESASHNKASPALSTEGGEEGKGRVQSEVVRLSERLEKMERIALERQEKERERERARERSERERQLSARVRQLEGTLLAVTTPVQDQAQMPHHRPSDLFLSREAEEEKARAAAPGRDSEREAEAKAAAILKRAEEQRLAAEKAAAAAVAASESAAAATLQLERRRQEMAEEEEERRKQEAEARKRREDEARQEEARRKEEEVKKRQQEEEAARKTEQVQKEETAGKLEKERQEEETRRKKEEEVRLAAAAKEEEERQKTKLEETRKKEEEARLRAAASEEERQRAEREETRKKEEEARLAAASREEEERRKAEREETRREQEQARLAPNIEETKAVEGQDTDDQEAGANDLEPVGQGMAADAAPQAQEQMQEQEKEGDVSVDLVLDMQLEEIAGKEEEFKVAVVQDLVLAVGATPDKVHVLALEAGSIIAKLLLQKSVCGDNISALQVALELAKQAEAEGSRLKYGQVTCRAKSVQNINIIAPARATPLTVLLTFEEWEAAYGDVVETQDMRRLFSEIDTEKRGKISLQQWIDFLRPVSMTSAPVDMDPKVDKILRFADNPNQEVEFNAEGRRASRQAAQQAEQLLFARHDENRHVNVGLHAVRQGETAAGGDSRTRPVSAEDDDIMQLLQEADSLYYSNQKGNVSEHRRASRPPPIEVGGEMDSRQRYSENDDEIVADSVSSGPATSVALRRPSTRPAQDESETTTARRRSLSTRVMCYCCLGWDEFWERRSCCGFFMHSVSVVCLALGLIAGGWEMGCNKISDKDSQGWEELWRNAEPYCEPIYRLGFSSISAGFFTFAWLAAFFAPPPRGYWRMLRRLRTLERKEAEEEERIREMYVRHQLAKNGAASAIRQSLGSVFGNSKNSMRPASASSCAESGGAPPVPPQRNTASNWRGSGVPV